MLLNRKDRVLPDSSSATNLANAFCRFFTTKIKNIRRVIDDRNTVDISVLATSKPICELSQFSPLSEEEVQQLVNQSAFWSCTDVAHQASHFVAGYRHWQNWSILRWRQELSQHLLAWLSSLRFSRNHLWTGMILKTIVLCQISATLPSSLKQRLLPNSHPTLNQIIYRIHCSRHTGQVTALKQLLSVLRTPSANPLIIKKQCSSLALTFQLHSIPLIKISCPLGLEKCMELLG